MKKYLILAMAVLAIAVNYGFARAKDLPLFTISGGTAETLAPTSGPTPIPVGTTGYSDALVTISKTRAYKFEFLGCGNALLDNRFYVISSGHVHHFDCATSKIGDSFIANLKMDKVKAHWPFHFQAAADNDGPSVFNGEGPLNGTYSNGVTWSNMSIFYAIEGSTGSPGATSGDVLLMGLTDGGVSDDNDHQDLGVRVSVP